MVASRDDAVAGRVFGVGDADAVLGEEAVALEAFPGGVVELRARLVIAGDHDRPLRSVTSSCGVPLINECVHRVRFVVVNRDAVAPVLEVGIGVTVVQRFQCGAFCRIALADDLT